MFLPTRYIGDPGRLRQILTNLIGNAVKFTDHGHVLVRVVGLEGETGQQELHVTVEDTGVGIAAENLSHVFGEFNQVETAANRKFEGTGLGLAITKRLIERMQGEVWVDSELGKGSCFGFRLSLPVAETAEPARGVRAAHARGAGDRGRQRHAQAERTPARLSVADQAGQAGIAAGIPGVRARVKACQDPTC